jgi:hypothetical protein
VVPNPVLGDLDNGGIVTTGDLSILRQFIGTTPTALNDARDLNHDGKIDEKDVVGSIGNRARVGARC